MRQLTKEENARINRLLRGEKDTTTKPKAKVVKLVKPKTTNYTQFCTINFREHYAGGVHVRSFSSENSERQIQPARMSGITADCEIQQCCSRFKNFGDLYGLESEARLKITLPKDFNKENGRDDKLVRRWHKFITKKLQLPVEMEETETSFIFRIFYREYTVKSGNGRIMSLNNKFHLSFSLVRFLFVHRYLNIVECILYLSKKGLDPVESLLLGEYIRDISLTSGDGVFTFGQGYSPYVANAVYTNHYVTRRHNNLDKFYIVLHKEGHNYAFYDYLHALMGGIERTNKISSTISEYMNLPADLADSLRRNHPMQYTPSGTTCTARRYFEHIRGEFLKDLRKGDFTRLRRYAYKEN